MHRERMERNRFFVPCTKPEKLVRMTSEGERGRKKSKFEREKGELRERERRIWGRKGVDLPSKWQMASQKSVSLVAVITSKCLSFLPSLHLCTWYKISLPPSLSFWERKRRKERTRKERGEEEWDERIFGIGYEKGLNGRSSSFSSTPSLFSFHSNFTPFPSFLFSIPTNWRMEKERKKMTEGEREIERQRERKEREREKGTNNNKKKKEKDRY